MAQRISSSKGFSSTAFDTYVPELSDNADIQNAFELFYYGDSTDGNATGDVSLHANLVSFDTRITTVTSGLSGHTGAISDVHGVGAGHAVVGTGTAQTLTNKTLTSPVISGGTINGGVALTADSTELNTLDGITASTAELNIMDGITASTAELNIMDGVTASTAELNIMDGVTASTAELNTLDGITASTAELNIMDGVTASTAELNTLDGITATVLELNTLDGITATVTELNYVDGVTSAIQTQLNTKSPSADPTFTGTVVLPSTTSVGNVSSTEISHLDGVTSSIQTQINTNTPTGMISIHAGATAPTGWLLCDGASHSTTSYAALFSVIGYTFGGGGASFNLPNLKGRVVVGIDSAQASFDARGETGGDMTHQHTASNSGNTSIAHNHTIDPPATGSSGAGDHGHNLTAHSHYSDHSHYADHSHSINPGSTTSSTAGSHSHDGILMSATGNSFAVIADNTSAGSHSHTTNIATFTSANANGAGITTGNSNYGNTAGANANTTSSSPGNHSHTTDIGAFNTVGGEGGSHAHTIPASSSLSNLQPYIALNYIIKI